MRRIIPPIALILLACLLAAVASSCRTTEIMSAHLTVPESAANQLHAVTINMTMYAEDISVGQGKSVPVKALADLALAAAQTGNPSANQSDNSGETPQPPVVAPAVPDPGQPAPPATAEPATPIAPNTSGTDPPKTTDEPAE
jgi:hypothetical protein